VAAGSLEAMLPRDRRTQRLRIPVDEAFLDEMTGWREELARDVFKNNHGLTARQSNEVVQRLLDRIVFIRIAEDRRVIERFQLRAAAEEWRARGGKLHIFDWLRPLFEKINEDFNGEIFKPNELLEGTQVDSEILARTIERLYPPKSPYRFDVIGVELLGSIYERYLGKTIRPTAKTVRVEEKPEVRKAGGVYYTPQYIMDYIVKNTVGKIIEGKSPKQIEKIRILDPACGSGSFLIGAFQCLIDYHIQWYLAHPEQEVRHAHPSLDFMREVQSDPDGGHRLSVFRKARILRTNLFGVDIDPQAVEITMMSLYLKALEGEKSQLPPKQHLLPELKYNIICGNSLIGPDIYQQGTFFGDAERDRINAFDWFAPVAPGFTPAPAGLKAGATRPSFGDIMRSGGFDCVIGNPPYVRIQHMKEWAPFEVEHYKERYRSASSGNYDIYVVFVEKGLSVLSKGGRLGYILPHKFFNAKYGAPLRALIAEGKHLSKVVHFGDQQVFDGATNYTCLLFLEKDGKDKFQFAKVDDLEAWRNAVAADFAVEPVYDRRMRYGVRELAPAFPSAEAGFGGESGGEPPHSKTALDGKVTEGVIPASRATASEWNFAVGAASVLMERLSRFPTRLGDAAARIGQGIRTSANEVYVLDLITGGGRTVTARSEILQRDVRLERSAVAPFLQGREIKPYRVLPPEKIVILPYRIDNGAAQLIPAKELERRLPRAWEYLRTNRKYLEARERGRFHGTAWYVYGRQQNIDPMLLPKILVPDIADRASFALDERGEYAFTSGYGITLKGTVAESPKYILSLLNSRLLDWYLKKISTTMRGGFFRYFTQYIEQLPICTINFSDPAEKARHDKMVALVERMLELNKQKHSSAVAAMSSSSLLAGGDTGATDLEHEIAATDAEIDNLVYELYGITDEERRIIEGA
jgi:type I restriction-modification system DNA methylase subunit